MDFSRNQIVQAKETTTLPRREWRYNNEGPMSVGEVERIMRKYGEYDLLKTDYQRFKADKTSARNHKADSTVEYLHVLEKK